MIELKVKNGGRGFTLLESLVAIMILVIMLTGGMAFYYQANALYYSGLRQRIATSIASSRMEVCKNEGYEGLKDASETVCRDAGTSVSVGQLTGTRRVVVVDSGIYASVAATVSWTDPNGFSRSVSLQTIAGM